MIQLESVNMRQGEFTLQSISFQVPPSQYGVLMGKTGSGKTTILEAILGLRSIRSGSIRLGSRDVTGLRPALRGVGYVPQDGVLFASMTVAEQIGLALTVRRHPRKAVKARVEELAELLGITNLLKRRPVGLSGGERQRVALGRALSFRPDVLCLDEPLSALDEETRAQMLDLLKEVKQHTDATVLHVTHNLGEAKQLADIHFRLKDGSISVDESE